MTEPYGLLLTRDLMFTSKVTGTASVLGWRVETVSSLEGLAQRVSEATPRVVFVDLNCTDFEPAGVMNVLKQSRPSCVIAFGSHVDETRLAQARDAGCDEVMPRSKFSATLPQLLSSIFETSKSS